MTVLAVAAVSARLMAEAAARDGFEVIALDLFGDVDTCEVASRWFSIGAGLRIDPERTLAALQVLAHRGDVVGWVAGSGFEGEPELLARGAAVLPLIGCAPEVVAAVRDPARFFGVLAAQGVAHPAFRFTPPDDAAGWLAKDARGCGGWHVRRLAPVATEAVPPHTYFQREHKGVPMSATFVANGQDALIVGFNEQMVFPFGARPFVYGGVIGPVPLPAAAARRAAHAVRAVAAGFSLRGLCSLDFLLDGDHVSVLEVNPRPPASMALYAQRQLMGAHLRACLLGELPAAPTAPPAGRIQGLAVVFARQALVLDERAVLRVAAWPGTHDLPCAGTQVARGDPLCSLSASGATAAQVRTLLNEGRQALLTSLETTA
jgi:predicted ATP-grasp superfamily ATP-dependent carboligase